MGDPLPCPFCGCELLDENQWIMDDADGPFTEVPAYECRRCKAGAPQSVWNHRGEIPWQEQLAADNYLGRISKPDLLSLGELFFSDWAAEGAGKRSKKQLAEDLEGVFAGEDQSMPAGKRAEALDWIPEGFKVTQA